MLYGAWGAARTLRKCLLGRGRVQLGSPPLSWRRALKLRFIPFCSLTCAEQVF